MVFREDLLDCIPQVVLDEDYEVRPYRPGDEAGQVRVMRAAGFDTWNEESLRSNLAKALPNGLFLAMHKPRDLIVGAAMSIHNPSELHPFGGELGWVACDPDHSGKGLGAAVCAAVVRRFAVSGYRRIYLKTDDWRLAAIKIYLSLGFEPFLFLPDMQERWRAVCGRLDWPSTGPLLQ